MIRKTALLTGIAGALLIAAPAFAQETQPQDQNATEAAATAQPQSLTLNPGATVKSADGSELGKLVGARNGNNGQELTVRGSDGIVRPVGLAGIRQDGADIVVDATVADFNAAAPVEGSEPAPAPTPADATKTDDHADHTAPEQPDEPNR